jgi:hypothetical protein
LSKGDDRISEAYDVRKTASSNVDVKVITCQHNLYSIVEGALKDDFILNELGNNDEDVEEGAYNEFM